MKVVYCGRLLARGKLTSGKAARRMGRGSLRILRAAYASLTNNITIYMQAITCKCNTFMRS